MSDKSLNAPETALNADFETVWFEGNGSTSVSVYEGQGVCYNWDYGTAADVDARRRNHVELPTILNAKHFAGVLDSDYTIPAGGRFVRVNLPGSQCFIRTKASVTVGVGILTCEAGGTYAGYFRYAGFEGVGSAIPLQTKDTSSTVGLTQAVLQTGAQSGLVEALDVTTGGAKTCMVGGVTVIEAATGALGAHATFTLADGTLTGQRKKFYCAVDLGNSYDFIVTVAGIQVDGSTTLATIILDDIGDEDTLEWNGDWYEKGRVGTTVS